MPPRRKAQPDQLQKRDTPTTVSSPVELQAAAPPPDPSPTRRRGGAKTASVLMDKSPTRKRRKADRFGGLSDGGAAVAVGPLSNAPLSPGMGRQHDHTRSRRADSSELDGSPLQTHFPLSQARKIESLMESVIKVFCVHSEPNFSLPWQRKRQYASSGSGFVISGRRLLTNAHCVDHHTQVKVKRRGSDTKFVATVLSIGAECDIALLAVEDNEFWEGLLPVAFGDLPHLQDAVTVCGYPIGGDTMSVTQGVVSRIEVTPYVHGATELLGIQVDAAINSGSSGGPAFNKMGQCVGIAFQSLKNEDVENTSYIIPTPVVQHFINDYERHGKYTGFPALGVDWQSMESPVMRAAIGLTSGQRGVLIRRVEPTSAASKVLQRGDVLLSFDGVHVGVDGTVPFRSGERIGFSYLVSQKMSGDLATLTVWSGGKLKEVSVELRPPTRLIPVHIQNRPPSYFIYGGLVFTPVTVPLLRAEFGKEYDYEAPVKILDKMLYAMAENEDQQIVLLSQVLAAETNVGYESICNTQVLKVNEKKINNLEELVRAVEECTEKYLQFELEYDQVVILDRMQAGCATADILRQHCVDADRSADVGQPRVTLGDNRVVKGVGKVEKAGMTKEKKQVAEPKKGRKK